MKNYGLVLLLSLPASVLAQSIYVSNYNMGSGYIGAYDATTGASQNANLASGSYDFAVSGNDLFIVSGTSVSRCNATTGAVIDASFISGLVDQPQRIVISGGVIYISNNNSGSGYVSAYDLRTGASINSNLAPGAYAFAVSGNNLFSISGTNVSEYDATTGAAINASFISGLTNQPQDIIISGGVIYISNNNSGNGYISTYNLSTGASINSNLLNGAYGFHSFDVSGNNLFISNGSNGISECNAITGVVINANFITGLNQPQYIHVAAVPEPSSYGLLGAGTIVAAALVRRRRQSKSV